MSHRCLQIWVRRAHEWEDRAVHVGAMHNAIHAPTQSAWRPFWALRIRFREVLRAI